MAIFRVPLCHARVCTSLVFDASGEGPAPQQRLRVLVSSRALPGPQPALMITASTAWHRNHRQMFNPYTKRPSPIPDAQTTSPPHFRSGKQLLRKGRDQRGLGE